MRAGTAPFAFGPIRPRTTAALSRAEESLRASIRTGTTAGFVSICHMASAAATRTWRSAFLRARVSGGTDVAKRISGCFANGLFLIFERLDQGGDGYLGASSAEGKRRVGA